MTEAQKVIKYLAIALAVFLIFTIISAILSAIYALAGVLGLKKNDNKTVNSEMSITNFENKNITTLDLSLAYADLTIKTGEQFKLETNNNNITSEQHSNTLKIKEKGHKWLSKDYDEEIIIYIPENLEFEEVEISTGAGKVIIESMTTKKLSFELGAGETQIKSLNVLREAEIEGGAGRLEISSGSINNLDLDMGVGEIILDTELKGKSDIDAGVGNLRINLIGQEDSYAIKTSKGLGSIKIDGKEVSNDSVYGNGTNQIEIDGGIGNIDIDFE